MHSRKGIIPVPGSCITSTCHVGTVFDNIWNYGNGNYNLEKLNLNGRVRYCNCCTCKVIKFSISTCILFRTASLPDSLSRKATHLQ